MKKYKAKLFGDEILPVQPLSAPTGDGILYYLDYQYGHIKYMNKKIFAGDPDYEELRKKYKT